MLPHGLSSQQTSYEKTSIGTYNILMRQPKKPTSYTTNMGYDFPDSDNPIENSERRYNIIKNNIIKANVDIICLQELFDHTFVSLKEDLFFYGYTGEWEKHERFHGVGIFYRENRYTRVLKQVHLFETQKNSEQQNAGLKKKRVHLSLDLMDRITGIFYRIVSVHLLDARSLNQQDEHTSFVVKTTHQYPSGYRIKRTIIAGDMNLDQWGNNKPSMNATPDLNKIMGFKPFLSSRYFMDGSFESTEYTKTDDKIVSKERCIDYIFVRSFNHACNAKPKPEVFDNFDPSGSDHRLVISTFSERVRNDRSIVIPNLNGLQDQVQNLPTP